MTSTYYQQYRQGVPRYTENKTAGDADDRTKFTGGQSSRGHGGYLYRGGMSEDDYIKANALRTDDMGARIFSPIYGMSKAIRGRRAYGKYRDEYNRFIDANDANARAYKVDERAWTLDRMQDEEDSQRNRALGSLDAAIADPTRDQAREDQYDAQVGNALAGLDQDYREVSRQDRTRMAKRGVLGGSYDIEAQARRGAAFQHGTMGAVQAAQRLRTDLVRADRNVLARLREALLSGDPGKAEEALAMAERDAAETERGARYEDFLTNRSRLRAGAADDQSRLIGNIGYAAAGSVNNRYAGY